MVCRCLTWPALLTIPPGACTASISPAADLLNRLARSQCSNPANFLGNRHELYAVVSMPKGEAAGGLRARPDVDAWLLLAGLLLLLLLSSAPYASLVLTRSSGYVTCQHTSYFSCQTLQSDALSHMCAREERA